MFIDNQPTVVAGIYLSAKSELKRQTIDSFEKWYETIPTNKSVIICGDFNIDMIAYSTHSRRLNNFCDDNGLKLLTVTPTRVTQDTATMIDLCFSNLSANKISCRVSIDNQISDHAILEIQIQGRSEIFPTKTREITIWKDYNAPKLWKSIEEQLYLWQIVESRDVNTKVNWILAVLSKATEQFKCVKQIQTKDTFFDNELENMRREKNRLYKIAQYSFGSTVAKIKWHEYRIFKNTYKHYIQQKKFEQNQRKLNKVQGDAKATWKILNDILSKENGDITIVKNGEIELVNDLDIANGFNQYFICSITELNESIPNHQHVEEVPVNLDATFQFRNVSIAEIKYCLRELKNNTDEFFIKPSVLLDAIFVLGTQIADVINESFSSGIFPDALKTSIIKPIQKIAGSVHIADYRPINMLCCVERLMELLAYNQFNAFIKSNNILNDNQSGFRAQHSCETAINDVLYEWREAQDQSKIIIAVFLDFQRAFETIDQNLLVKKLAKYGVVNNSLDWFNSYLSNRKQIVKIGETKSQELNNSLGVPQGSILGPLLFILYINHIPACLKHCVAKMFADDTLVYVISDRIDEATQKINEDLNILYERLCQNKLKLNVNKTKVMIICNKNIDKNSVNIHINGTRLKIENEIKYLGNIIDDKLKFDKNINNVCKKVGQKCNVLSRLRHEMNLNQKLTIYKSIVEPHFSYCSSILYLSNKTDLDRLQVIQNRCLRQILNANRFTNSHEMLTNLKLMNVQQIIVFRTLIFIYKITKGLAPPYLANKIKYNYENQSRMLRNAGEIKVTNANKSCSQNSLFYNGIKLFNSIPLEIKNADSLTTFQTKIRKYVLEKY